MIKQKVDYEEKIFHDAMIQCLRPWYTDDCESCRREFMRCLSNYLSSLN